MSTFTRFEKNVYNYNKKYLIKNREKIKFFDKKYIERM